MQVAYICTSITVLAFFIILLRYSFYSVQNVNTVVIVMLFILFKKNRYLMSINTFKRKILKKFVP